MKKHGLAFHDGEGSFGAKVSEAEDGRTVSHDRNAIILNRQGAGLSWDLCAMVLTIRPTPGV